jgi:tetratricopeptide (TPR) repeat protein
MNNQLRIFISLSFAFLVTVCSGAQDFVTAQPWIEEQRKLEADRKQKMVKQKSNDNLKGQIIDDEHRGLDAQKAENYAEAEKFIRKAISEAEALDGKVCYRAARLWNALGCIYGDWNKPDEAEEYLKKSLLMFNTLQSSDREEIYSPADSYTSLLQGSGLPATTYKEWMSRRHANPKETQELIAKLHYVREHPFEMATFDPSWGAIESPKNTALESYCRALQASVKKNWHAPAGEKPEKKTLVILTVAFEGYQLDPYNYSLSGSDAFDKSCLAAVKSAAPYPKLPEGFNRDDLVLEFAFDSNGPGVPCIKVNH